MQLRKLLILLGVLSLLVSRSVMALGLGDIKLNSSLNEPLDAHINLIDIGELDSDQIIARLADEKDFRRLGIEREFFYTQLRFNVITDQSGGPFIAVTSKDPVREPFISIVVEVRWTSGRLLREYTVLLDLPVFADEAARPVEATATPLRDTSTPVKSEPVRTATEPGAVSANRSNASDVYGPVKANDTLWEIARDVRPGRESIQQTMLAIQRANPEAFIRGNINLLRKGQVLRIPSSQEINRMSNRQAITQVAQQNRDWSGNAMGAQLDASGRGSSIDRSDSSRRGQVKLAAPGTTGAGGTAQGGGYGNGDAGEIAGELAATEEELERSMSENNELRSRVTDLEEQIETMERLLEVSNEQLSALQTGSAEQQQAANDAEAAQTEIDTETTGTVVAATEQAASSVTSESAVDEPEAETEVTAVEEKAKASKVVRRPPEPSLMDKLMANILWIGLAIIGLIVAVFVILRKRSGTADSEEEFTSEFDDSVFNTEDDEPEEDQPVDDADESFEEAFAEEVDTTPTEAETGDVVGEADIYIAYAKYDQAEEMLLNGLEKEPGSQAIQLKLLEVYAESDNRSAFNERYSALIPQADAATTEKANDLRAQFGPMDDADDMGAAMELDDLGLDLEQNEETSPVADTQPEADNALELDAELDSELDLDGAFELDDLEQSAENDSSSEELLELGTEEDELSLDDFDFELDDTEQSSPEKAATDEVDLDGSATSYDLSFDAEETELDSDAELLDFELEDDETDSAAPLTESAEDKPTALADEEPLLDLDTLDIEQDVPADTDDASDDVFTLDLDDSEELATSDDSTELDDLSFDLEDDTTAAEPSELDSLGDLDLGDLELEGDDTPAAESEAPLLDEDFDLSLDETPAADAVKADADEEAVPTLDLADDDADDFDLDQAMGDVDLEALDREMADLDTPTQPDAPVAEPAADETFAGVESDEMDLSVDEDDAFDEALGDLDVGLDVDDLPSPESVSDTSDDDEDLDFLADADEAATKLDLARAYIDMGDMEGAKDILSEVVEEGTDEQKQDAQSLLEKVDS
ncbi:hypothetical protein KO507_04810 [Gilvimarinus agarilyticus]|uniref:FimV/HubP family polar landmark protein n=1 Tax=Gilvimarinus sp. 2_MG-2023 TaxID=3062666 RepID=UPI001C08F6BC|nr:FimV/HubP family polar landmark protein [Gilvimarinus sp. 2_MG-2023]MBU2885082.1 hypothetical protein [Gilvimarinus agarilyticus]MDO6569979.1 FimV/HubP family polar landmark protein [Gilvimarinus sp. 2_MG-2023]